MTLGLMLLLVPLVLIVAAVYASVGLGGGTGYLAVMALVGVPQGAIVHTALLLNIVVTGVAYLRFGRAGRMRWRLFLPFFLPAIPCAFLGGLVELDRTLFFGMLAVVLFLAGIGMVRSAADARERDELPNRPNRLEPRRRKRRPKEYSLMQHPRHWYHRRRDSGSR